MTRLLALCLLGLAAAGCAQQPISPDEAADRCEQRARAAQGPTGSVTIGANSDSGGFSRTAIRLSGDYLRGRDPERVYSACVLELTGGSPIRPLRLR